MTTLQKRERERKALEGLVGEFEYEDDNDEEHHMRIEVSYPHEVNRLFIGQNGIGVDDAPVVNAVVVHVVPLMGFTLEIPSFQESC